MTRCSCVAPEEEAAATAHWRDMCHQYYFQHDIHNQAKALLDAYETLKLDNHDGRHECVQRTYE
jgi:hypothetical protein